MGRRHTLVTTALLAGLLLPCAPWSGAGGARAEEAPPSAGAGADYDPLERMNRGIFWFNDTLDVYALAPAARGWDYVLPDPVQRSVANFFANLRFPVDAVNNLLQGKVQPAAITVGRFVVNTTVGAAGFFDPASRFGLEEQVEDFGQTLGRWKVPPGPYLVLPLLGPSNVRDTGGMVVDYGLRVIPFFVDGFILMGAGAVNAVNERSLVLDEVAEAKAASLDYYSLVRNAYYQRRDAAVRDAALPDGPAEDLYDDTFDDHDTDDE